jgi:hypothetical protein
MNTVLQDVLTLEEVASYLRLPNWRFLKKAIDDWLQSHDSRDIFLYQAGSLADDETLADLRTSIYAERGRPEVETDED